MEKLKNEAYLIGDDIVFFAVRGDQTELMLNEVIAEAYRITDQVKEKGFTPKYMIDLSEATTSNMRTRELALSRLKEAPDEYRAFIGASKPIKMITQFLLRRAGIQDYNQFFKTKEEAIEWLKSIDAN